MMSSQPPPPIFFPRTATGQTATPYRHRNFMATCFFLFHDYNRGNVATPSGIAKGADRPGRQSGGAAKIGVITAKVGVMRGHHIGPLTTFRGGKMQSAPGINDPATPLATPPNLCFLPFPSPSSLEKCDKHHFSSYRFPIAYAQ